MRGRGESDANMLAHTWPCPLTMASMTHTWLQAVDPNERIDSKKVEEGLRAVSACPKLNQLGEWCRAGVVGWLEQRLLRKC